MSEPIQEINIMELLLKISNDVSSIKTDMTNFKEAQRLEKENTTKEIADARSDCEREIEDLEKRLNTKINNLQAVQNTLVGDVDTLKRAEEQKDAKKWRTVMTFVGTALGGMFIAKLPDIIRTLIIIFASK